MRILDAQLAALDAQDPVARVAELEDVAGHALDGEILVHAADRQRGRLDHDGVVGGIGNRAGRGQCGQARIAPAAQLAVHGVAVHIASARAVPRRVTLGEHAHDRVEISARQLAIGPGPTQPVV